jgi:hypothetical protein
MLFKAHRFRSGPDIYNPAERVLKTICKDPESHRFRDVRPGEEIESVWDHIHHEGTQFLYGTLPDRTDGSDTTQRFLDESKNVPRGLFYHKADELEDDILFPEERAEKKLDPLNVGKADPIEIWQEGLSLRKFVEGWESDSDFSEWESFSPGEEDNEDEIIENDAEGSVDEDDEDDEMGNTENGADEKEGGPNIGNANVVRPTRFSDEMREILKKLSLKDKPAPKVRLTHSVMNAEFMTFLDREKAKSMILHLHDPPRLIILQSSNKFGTKLILSLMHKHIILRCWR